MHGYLSVNIISSVRETVSLEGQIISRIYVRATEAVVFIIKVVFATFNARENVYEQFAVCCVRCSLFNALWYDFMNKQTSRLVTIPKHSFVLNLIMNKRLHSRWCMVWKNGEYYDNMMCLNQSRGRKALREVYSNDYLTLIQHLKKKWKKCLYDSKTSNLRFSL